MTIFATLRAAIGSERYDPSVVLGAIAESAQAMTGANAAALAMRREGLVICRARSGDMAPAVGSRLSVDSGISGECLRTGKVLRCDDTEKDYRVDPEVCRRLGLRSIAIVPLRGRRGTMGVLEAFSTRPYAFAEEHMDYLIRLAELAENARLRESGIVESAEEAKPAPPQPKTRVGPTVAMANAIVRARTVLGPEVRNLASSRTARVALATVAVSLLVLLGFSGWNSHRAAPAEAAVKPAPAVVQTAATSPEPAAAQSDLVWKPSPAHVAAAEPATKTGVETASKRDLEQVTSAPPNTEQQQEDNKVLSVPPSTTAAAEGAPAEPPKMAALPAGRAIPLASIPVEMPGYGSPVSQGLSGGVLTHKVLPSYPLQALPMRLSGTVVLEATVSERGTVEDMKIVSGPPLLTAAAMDAVRQWRYTPYLLDGKPVKMQKEISISFRAP